MFGIIHIDRVNEAQETEEKDRNERIVRLVHFADVCWSSHSIFSYNFVSESVISDNKISDYYISMADIDVFRPKLIGHQIGNLWWVEHWWHLMMNVSCVGAFFIGISFTGACCEWALAYARCRWLSWKTNNNDISIVWSFNVRSSCQATGYFNPFFSLSISFFHSSFSLLRHRSAYQFSSIQITFSKSFGITFENFAVVVGHFLFQFFHPLTRIHTTHCYSYRYF